MRTIILFVISVAMTVMLAGCSKDANTEDVSTTELQSMLSEDYQFVDIRTVEEYNAGHIEEFNINIDYYQFKDDHEMLNDLDKSKPVVIICRSGNRSGQAKKLLSDLGFEKVYNVTGGVSSWNGELVK